MRTPLRWLSLLALACAAPAHAQCGAWSEGLAFPALSYPGVEFGITDSAVFDDGTGEHLYVCGSTTSGTQGPARGRAARWNGRKWDTLFEVYPQVFPTSPTAVEHIAGGMVAGVACVFVSAYNHALSRRSILRWDGTTLTSLGDTDLNKDVFQLDVLADGGGSALYVSGTFNTLGGVNARRVAKWNGASWSSFGNGPVLVPGAVAFLDTGTGPKLHAGGHYTEGIARFDGVGWTSQGQVGKAISSFAVYDSGAGPENYAGSSKGLLRWNGSAWATVSTGDEYAAYLTVADLGGGPLLYVNGHFGALGGVSAENIASYDGATFAPLASGLSFGNGAPNPAVAGRLHALSDGGATKLCVRGVFTSAGGLATKGLAQWDGASWSLFGRGFDGPVQALASYDLGAGTQLFAIGAFKRGGGDQLASAEHFARWDGASWRGLVDFGADARAITGADLGNGRKLYVAGLSAGAAGLVSFDGAAWANVGGGLHGEGLALIEYDAGAGPWLFVGGNFVTPAGPGEHVAAWNGTAWSALAGGMNGSVAAFATFDAGAGAGTELVAGGAFTLAGGIAAERVARWNGTGWLPLGAGIAAGIGDGAVNALCAFDGALYAGGTFTLAGGTNVQRIARWDGVSWSDVPSGGADGPVFALCVHDDGRGPALYAGGAFTTLGGITAYNLARFDGAAWEAVDGGIDGAVRTFASLDDDGDGDDELFAGGTFTQTALVACGHVARLEGCPHYVRICSGDGSTNDHATACPCGNVGAPRRGCGNSFDANGAELSATGSIVLDTVALRSQFEPASAFTLMMQHVNAGDTVFHDGVLCAGGSLIRLRGRAAVAGEMFFPNSAFAQDSTTTLSQRGSVTVGSGATRFYAAWYRNASSTFCPPATANVTNGVRVVW